MSPHLMQVEFLDETGTHPEWFIWTKVSTLTLVILTATNRHLPFWVLSFLSAFLKFKRAECFPFAVGCLLPWANPHLQSLVTRELIIKNLTHNQSIPPLLPLDNCCEYLVCVPNIHIHCPYKSLVRNDLHGTDKGTKPLKGYINNRTGIWLGCLTPTPMLLRAQIEQTQCSKPLCLLPSLGNYNSK